MGFVRSAPGLLCCVIVLAVIIGGLGIRRSRRNGGTRR
jgi:hypothetical protein